MFGFDFRTRSSSRPHDVYDISGTADGALTGFPGGEAIGFVGGTRVAASQGWCPVEEVNVGDSVLTFDTGLKKVLGKSDHLLWSRDIPCPRRFWPYLVPKAALRNKDEMLLLPDQAVIIESEISEMIHGDRFTLIQAAALDGWRGIRRVIPCKPVRVVTLHFDEPEILIANIGLKFLCQPAKTKDPLIPGQRVGENGYQFLSDRQAKELMGYLELEDEETGAAYAAPVMSDYAAFAA